MGGERLINTLSLKRGLLDGEDLFEKGGLNKVNRRFTVLENGSKGPQTPLLWVLCRMDLSFKSSIDQFSFSTSL